MARRNLGIAPAIRPWARPVRNYEFITIMIAILGIGIALGTLVLTTTGRIEARLDSAIAEAAADRRASDAKMEEWRSSMDQYRRDSDAKMDEFRSHMQRLGERQARLEGQRDGAAQQ